MGYCWPGWLFPRFWQVAHNIPVAMLAGLSVQRALGDKGYELAWQHRHFASLAQFKETMAVWITAAKVAPLAVLGVLVLRMLGGYVAHVAYR